MKHLFQKGNKINLGRKSKKKGLSYEQILGKERSEEVKRKSSETQKGKHNFQIKMNCQRCNKELISYTTTQKYCKQCKRYVNNHKYYNKNTLKCIVRSKTKEVFGSLPKGLEYHHFVPYKYDDFVILEKGLHRWMHGHPGSFKLGGLVK